MGTFSDAVEVIQSAIGTPMHLIWQGNSYTLAATPLRWFERRKWWEEVSRIAPGAGAGVVEREVWRVEMRQDQHPQAPLCSFDLVKYLPGERWRIIKVHDALVPQSTEHVDYNQSAGMGAEDEYFQNSHHVGNRNG